MKIALLSGSWPPARCGVGDYSACLADALEQRHITVLRYPRPGGALQLRHAAGMLEIMREDGADLIHVQYPAMGYGRSLLPAVLAWASRLPVIVTLHEFSIFRFYRMPWFLPFARKAHTLILTSAAEAAAFSRRFPRALARQAVVPIGTNIGRGRAAFRDPTALCHFGLLLPGKDIEAFLHLAEILREAGAAWRLHLIGAIPAGHEAYAARITQRARDLGVTLHLGLPADQVADTLSAMQVAYLPFPGGATERRGSLLAALANGVRVLTPIGAATPDWLKANIIDAQTPQDAASLLLAGLPARVTPDQTLSFGWGDIADRHIDIYDRAMRDARQA